MCGHIGVKFKFKFKFEFDTNVWMCEALDCDEISHDDTLTLLYIYNIFYYHANVVVY
jgi:hypothetical protein